MKPAPAPQGSLPPARVSIDGPQPPILPELASALLALGSSSDPWGPDTPRVFEAGLGDVVERTTVETRIEHEWLGSVADACARPREYLRHEEEVDRVDRVRRMAGNAASHLGAHPEHWERRRLGSVVPRNVLARRLDEELDIYENRVLVASVTEARSWVQDRVRRVSRAMQRIKKIDELLKRALMHNRHWVVARIATIAGHDIDWSRKDATAKQTLAALLALDRRLGRLFDSPVFQGLPAQAADIGALRDTNILANDVRYRRAVLMLKAVRHARQRPHQESAEARRERLEKAFHLFGNAVLRRALESLDFETQGEQRWSGSWGKLTVDQLDDGARLVRADGAILDVQTILRDAELVERNVAERVGVWEDPQRQGRRLFLLLESSREGAQCVLDDSLGITEIGPHDLTSVERVGHLIWTWLAIGLAQAGDESFHRTCPICRKEAEPKLWKNRGFRSICPSCATTWEARVCDQCDQPFPVLRVPRDEWSEDLECSRDWWARPEAGRYHCVHCEET